MNFKLFRSFKAIYYLPGEIILQQGDFSSEKMYIIIQGEIGCFIQLKTVNDID